MNELEWIKEFRRWLESEKAEKSARNLADAFLMLRQNIEPLNKELKDLNSNTKKSKDLLSKIAGLQEEAEKQTTWMMRLTIIMAIFTAVQLYLTWIKQ